MYRTRNCNRTAMRDKSSVSSNKTNSVKNSKTVQKIPLTEVTETLRPRRGCKKMASENSCKENNVPQNKSSAKNKEFPKTSVWLKLSRSENNVSGVLKELPISGQNVRKLKNENASKSSILQSIQNLNLKNNKSDLLSNIKSKKKAPLKMVYQNEENHEKKDKVAASVKSTQESSIMRKFPKWISNGVESLKRGKKRVLNVDVYDIEADKDLMLEKSLTKKVVVKKARITKTKNYPTKHDSRTLTVKNTQYQLNKKGKAKKVVGKLSANICSEPCSMLQKYEGKKAKNGLPISQKQVGTEHNAVTLASEKHLSMTKTAIRNKETVQMKQFVDSNMQETISIIREEETERTSKILCSVNDKIGKSSEKLETPEKCPQTEILHEIDSSLNLQSFPMPQSSSTPQNADKPNVPAQMLCSSFEVTMLEIPPSQEMQVNFSDSEFLSPEKTSDAGDIQLFDSPVNEDNKVTKKDKARNKPSVVKNLNASLNAKKLEQKDTCKNNQLLIDSLLQTEIEILKISSQEAHLVTDAVSISVGKSNQATNPGKRKKPCETPENPKKNTPRPKRACQRNKPVIEESSDIESSFENDPDIHEITLFESPEKEGSHKEEQLQCPQPNTALKDLFSEEWNWSPVKVTNEEERVLKPRKSYPSSAQLKQRVIKAKKENKVQEMAQTKVHNKLIDSLNDHFAELEGMDLCIE